jgi:hypothetical protein
LDFEDQTITSIEVIDCPLAVGDMFKRGDEIGEVIAIHRDMAWMRWGVYGDSIMKIPVVNSYRRVTP